MHLTCTSIVRKPYVSPFQTGTEASTTKASRATANSLCIISKTLGFGKAIIKIFICTVSKVTTDNKSETCTHFCSRFPGEEETFPGRKGTSFHDSTQCARDLVATKHHSSSSQAEAEPDSAYWKANSEKAKTLKASTPTGSFPQTFS